VDYSDVPEEILAELRTVCLGLPETTELEAYAGRRWHVRKRTFAHVLCVDDERGSSVVMTFRSSGAELHALRSSGHPFFRPGWGSDVVGMVLGADTDWDEVAELLTDSYCILAPKKLAALVPRPDAPPDADLALDPPPD
jgi:hypothetical protein